MLRRPRRLILRLLLFAAVLALGLVAAELGYRVHVYGWRALRPDMLDSVVTLARSGILQTTPDPELRFELIPDHHVLFKMVHHDTNRFGMRDHEVTLEKPPGTRRIAVVGDSFTMGLGVELDETFVEVLERRLTQADPGRPTECLNFGVAAYGLSEYVGVVRNKVAAFDPDLVIVALTANDRMPPSPSFRHDRPRDRPFLEWHLLHRVQGLLHASWPDSFDGPPDPHQPAPATDTHPAPDDRPVGRDDRPPLVVLDPPPREWADTLPPDTMAYVRKSFRDLVALRDERNLPIMAVYLTQGFVNSTRGTINSQAFHKAAAEVGIPYCDTNPYLRGRALYDNIIFKNDTHPNAEVHAILADAIFDYLEASGWTQP